jgi:hypothetical protein
MPPLSGAKTRTRHRARGSGAVMFIVAMTLAVIAAMGMYALNVAATEIKTAGFIREETQLHYLSEFGVLGAAQEITGARTQLYRDFAINHPDTNCTSLNGVPVNAGPLPLACRVVGPPDLVGGTWTPPAPGPLIVAPWVNGSSETTRGSEGLPTTPAFYIELTDPTQRRPPSGYGMDQGLCFVEFTAATMGTSQLTPGVFVSEGLETSRGRLIGGPIKCF